jgi:hypothetical protein
VETGETCEQKKSISFTSVAYHRKIDDDVPNDVFDDVEIVTSDVCGHVHKVELENGLRSP